MKPVDFFSRDVHTFWATTFQLDLKLFDQFLLRRLGNEPLNAVVLCDEDDLTDTLGRLTEVDRHVAANANRRYLLRGMRVPSGGRFHPKTYLFASRRRTVLLVGSGNLTRSGLDRGTEVFTAFDAGEEHDQPVIRAWAAWIGEMMHGRDDELLRARYLHLRATLPVLAGQIAQDVFFSNAERTVADVIAEQRPPVVTELHVTAPYFDERAEALRGLIASTAPTDGVHVYVGTRPSVDGEALARVLAGAGRPASVHRFEPERFVHAKLIGLVGPGDCMLVCGSANLSHAALDRVYAEAGSRGNCEVVVVRRGTADEVRAAFCPPGSTLAPLDLSEVAGFRYESTDERPVALAIRILSARLDAERRIVLRTAPPVPAGLRVKVDDGAEPLPLLPAPAGATTEPLTQDADPLVVWIVDDADASVSNVVVLDDPRALEQMLGERTAARDRPDELADEDERSDLVTLLAWAHRQFIFDLEDTPAIKRARQSAESDEADPTGFWERSREELNYDQRSQTYRPLVPGIAAGNDLLLREIEIMLQAAPRERRLRLVRGDPAAPPEHPGTGHPWSLTARQQVRARNLIQRWARALPDPRHAWLAPEAPARNYEALIEVLALIWLGEALDADRITELLGETWTGLLGSETRKGLADRAEPELRDLVLGDVHSDVRELAAGMAYAALARPGWGAFIYDWQPFLVRGGEYELFTAGDFSCALVEALTGEPVSAQAIEDLLLRRAEYTDDLSWGARTAAELGLKSVRLVKHAGYLKVDLVVAVEGISDPAHDARTVVLARRAMAFKRSDHVLIQMDDERYLLRLGAVARARIDGRRRESIEPIDRARLDAVEQQGGTLVDLLGIAS